MSGEAAGSGGQPRSEAPMLGGMTENYSPAQTVEMSGFTLDTLRYYERIGLVGAVMGPAAIFDRLL